MIRIRKVASKQDWNKFFDFPVRLYADNDYYVPPLLSDERHSFDPEKNPAYAYCRTVCLLAEQDGRTVGRIAGIVNEKINEQQGTKDVRFTRFDVIDNPEVTRALMDELSAWAKDEGMQRIIGPMGFSGFDRQGMLVEGFDRMSMMLTLYNYRYYPLHLEQLGFTKEIDWIEYRIKVPESPDPRIERICSIAQRRHGYRLLEFKSRSEAIPYARKMFKMYNEAFAPLYGFSPLTPEHIEQIIKQYISFIPLEYLFVVTNGEDEVVGFGVMAPSISEAVRDAKGRLFPFGWLKIRKALQEYDVLDLYLIAVKPEYAGRGVNAVILNEGIKRAIAHGVSYAETGPELEDNENVQSQWKAFETEQHKRRRCYARNIQ
jgi:GNAT superfamily N-acetyltransferase